MLGTGLVTGLVIRRGGIVGGVGGASEVWVWGRSRNRIVRIPDAFTSRRKVCDTQSGCVPAPNVVVSTRPLSTQRSPNGAQQRSWWDWVGLAAMLEHPGGRPESSDAAC